MVNMKNDGGLAFPTQSFPRPDCEIIWGNDGMSLRDYFAAKAMAAIVTMPYYAETDEDIIADFAWRVADAMLKARMK